MKLIRIVVYVLLGVSLSLTVEAQRADETFGQNRIQYKKFHWKYLSSENFDIYFYGDRKKVTEEALQYLESEFDRITDLLGFHPYYKTKVFLYNSITDMQQSNRGLTRSLYSAGGEAEFVKSFVEIAHPGNLEEFKQELIYKMADLLVNEMMFGGGLKQSFQNAILSNLPDWFIGGISYYVAKGWNEEMDDYVRQLVRSKKTKKALRFSGKEGALVGQSIWNYIVEKYGKSSINNILTYTRIVRNEEKSISITSGTTFSQLMVDWKNFYIDSEKKIQKDYISLPANLKFSTKSAPEFSYTTVKISPDGKKIAYAENDRGRFSVKVKSLETGNVTVILHGGNRVIKQTVDYRVPLLSWSDANTLGVIGVKNAQYVFWLYDLKTHNKFPRELDKFSNIRSFNFSNNGKLIVISADFEGQNDLFLLSSLKDRTKRLTNDRFDDLDPSFLPHSNTLVFTSNRSTDSLKVKLKDFQQLPSNYNLFLYNIDTTREKLIRVTNTLSKDFRPRAIDDHTFFYLSDQRGIINLFKFDLSSGIYSQLTNYNSSIKDFDLNYDKKIVASVLTQNLREDIFVDLQANLDSQVFTLPTTRKQILQARLYAERKKEEKIKSIPSIKNLINSRLQKNTDPTSTRLTQPIPQPIVSPIKKDTLSDKKTERINTENYSFESASPDTTKPASPKTEKPLSTDDYVFEDEAEKTKQPNEVFFTRYMKAREKSRVEGPFSYLPKFIYENLVTNWTVDPLRGWGLRLETQMNDMLENYRIFGGIQTAFDFKNGDVYGEFQYLPYRFDFSASFNRKVIFWQPPNRDSGTEETQKYSFQKVELGVSYPFSVYTRLTLKTLLGYTQFLDRGKNLPQLIPGFVGSAYMPTETQFYSGGKLELVYDNSISFAMNSIEGTRAKLNFSMHQALGKSEKSFMQVYVDVRHYQKIYKGIILAGRGYVGTFFGNSPKNYLLGGMDNWLGRSFNYEGQLNPLVNNENTYNENLIFTEFATNLRGFDYATIYGNSVALANIELRIPLIRALSTKYIASNFFRNLQFTGFYDIGSSWTGEAPLYGETNGRTRKIESGPFTAEVREYLNPWLYSYGLGFRSTIFGYYLKLDVAWPVKNYITKDLRANVTFGFDF